MKDDYTINSHYLTQTFICRNVGRIYFQISSCSLMNPTFLLYYFILERISESLYAYFSCTCRTVQCTHLLTTATPGCSKWCNAELILNKNERWQTSDWQTGCTLPRAVSRPSCPGAPAPSQWSRPGLRWSPPVNRLLVTHPWEYRSNVSKAGPGTAKRVLKEMAKDELFAIHEVGPSGGMLPQGKFWNLSSLNGWKFWKCHVFVRVLSSGMGTLVKKIQDRLGKKDTLRTISCPEMGKGVGGTCLIETRSYCGGKAPKSCLIIENTN